MLPFCDQHDYEDREPLTAEDFDLIPEDEEERNFHPCPTCGHYPAEFYKGRWYPCSGCEAYNEHLH